MARTATLVEALALRQSGELVAIVGGGGKSSLMFRLGESLPGRVILTTTTRIFAAQIDCALHHCSVYAPDFERILERGERGLLVVGDVEGEKAMGVPAELPARLLARPDVAAVVVEADGSRMRPAKAPAGHEPAMPGGATAVVAVAGIDALHTPIRDACHRPERVAALTGASIDSRLTASELAGLLCHEEGGARSVPAGARFVILINKVESSADLRRAREVATLALAESRVERIVIGALAAGPQASWEIWQARGADHHSVLKN